MSLDDEINDAFEMAIAQLERPLGTQNIRHVMETMRAYAKSLVVQEREACAEMCELMHPENRGGDYAYAIRSRSPSATQGQTSSG